jgi:hypothetical protein
VRSTTIEILGSFETRERSVQETKNTKNKKSQQHLGLSPPPYPFYYGQLGPFVLVHKLVHTLATISITQ